MKTNFSETQLKDPRNKAAQEIVSKCVHCGLCTASCSSYVITGDERDSPRGRIYMIKDLFEGDKAPDAEVTKHLDRCLSCLSCMSACPSRVDYMHLIDLTTRRISAAPASAVLLTSSQIRPPDQSNTARASMRREIAATN